MKVLRSLKRFLVCTGAMLLAQPAFAQDQCHPAVDQSLPQFIVGYGSLMEEASKRRTAPDTGLNRPVRVRGFQRAWNARGNQVGFSTTYLGVDAPKTPDERKVAGDATDDPVMVAAAYQDFSAKGIAGTDERETFYCRYAVALDKIELLDGWAFPENAQVWIYALPRGQKGDLPNERWPIVQSYVDIFLTGCLDLEKRVDRSLYPDLKFADLCISTTTGWSADWVNDRLYPRRAFIYQPNASTIDQLLHGADKTSPLFDKILIE